MDKGAIKSFAINARVKLRNTVKNKMGMIGVTKDECSSPIQRGEGYEVYKTTAGTENKIYGDEIKQRQNLVKEIKDKGYENVVEEVAYTWFNRIIAIRFMEVNGYLPTRVRVLSSDTEGKIEPDILNEAPDIDLDFTEKDVEYILNAKSENRLDELFRFLFIKQCNNLGEILPELFEKTKDYTEMLLNISYINEDDVIRMLVDGVPEEDFTNEVEIIGWMYQYYISERHNEVINVFKGKSISKEDIPAATQLFTTDWVVRYMVDNSLGKYWIERNPISKLSDELEFYIKPKDGEKYIDEDIKLEELTFIDNCMGSGHILVYAFDVFMKIYKECGYSEKDATIKIVENNLYGLDIDKRAYQLSYFSIMMKARSYNRKIFSINIKPNLCEIIETNNIHVDMTEIMQVGITNNTYDKIQYLIKQYIDAKEIGSLQIIEKDDYDEALIEVNTIEKELHEDLVLMNWMNEKGYILKKIFEQAKIMSNKYTIIATNPPYLNKFDTKLKVFVNNNYKDYSGDLFSVFMYRNFEYLSKDGYSAFMTPNVWMYLKSYEVLRNKIINNKGIVSFIYLAKGSFYDEATVDICTFILKNSQIKELSTFFKLDKYLNDMNYQGKAFLIENNTVNSRNKYYIDPHNLLRISGSPLSFWASNSVINAFEKNKSIGMICSPCQGLATTNNDKFLRLWFEVSMNKINFYCASEEDSIGYYKWFPINKGGSFRKWYGNNDYVINYQNKGEELCEYIDKNSKVNHTGRVINRDKYFIENGTWSATTSSTLSLRYSPKGFIISNAGMAIYSETSLKKIIAFLNSKITTEILIKVINESINFNAGDIVRLPYIENDNKEIISLADECIGISKNDWDSFETSWDFTNHPLITYKTGGKYADIFIENWQYKIKDTFNSWKENAEINFDRLKKNEEELNRIFIDIYGLQDELTPEVEDKDVTIRKADRERDIKSFISYAVGCMLGRYSIDTEGIVYAGGNFKDIWDIEDKKVRSIKKDADGNITSDIWINATFLPEADNIIPINEEEYFENDIVTRFIEFVKTVYGKDTLEENLNFIAESLNIKGNSSREIIRNYFIKDFFKDHCSAYSVIGSGKRPIYWLFDSGKENGFKALIYMHRYDRDTVGRVRTEYLHNTQKALENSITRADHIIENSDNAREKSQATKEKNKYIKQLAETRIYDEAMAYIANKRIDIDLDDGVKVNYAKFQNIEVSREGQKSVTINLLAKI